MPFAALDLHKKQIQAATFDDQGNPVYHGRFPATRQALESFARNHLSAAHKVALEATFNTWAIVSLLQPFVEEVVVSNPMATRAIAQAKVKTDKIDTEVLAHLLRCDYLPRVWIPDRETRELRHQCTERATLDRHLRQLDALEIEIDALGAELAQHAATHPQVKLLMSIPGIDFTVAECLYSTLGDISRFPTADQTAAYVGLVPSTYQSGETCYHGRITKQGRAHARWLLVQAAQHLSLHPGPLGVFFRRLAKRKNRNVAVVATARKIVTIAWHMLTRNEPYRYASPKASQAKYDRLRLRAGGPKRKGATAKGSKRPASYGSGHPTRAIPSLPQVYADAGLPELKAPRPGEAKILRKEGLDEFAESIQKPRRVPKKKTATPSKHL